MKKEITFETKDIVLLIGSIIGSILICGAFFHLGIEYGYRHASVIEMHYCEEKPPKHETSTEPTSYIRTNPTKKSVNYVENEVIMTFTDNAKEEEIKKVLDHIKDLKNVNESYDIYVLEFNHNFESISKLKSFCDEITTNNKIVKHCEPNYIYTIPDCSKGPC